MTEYNNSAVLSDSAIYVGKHQAVVPRRVSSGDGATPPPPFSHFRNGKPEGLLVLDSTWNTLVLAIDEANKRRSRFFWAITISPLVALISAIATLCYFSDITPDYPVAKGTISLAFVAQTMILVVIVTLTGYVIKNAREKPFTDLLEEKNLYYLFQRDGYRLSVHTKKWPRLFYNPYPLKFERIESKA